MQSWLQPGRFRKPWQTCWGAGQKQRDDAKRHERTPSSGAVAHVYANEPVIVRCDRELHRMLRMLLSKVWLLL